MNAKTIHGRAAQREVGPCLRIPIHQLQAFDGDHLAVLLMNQIQFWSTRCHDPEGWVYKSYQEWQREIFLSEWQVRRISDQAVKEGYLQFKVQKVNGFPVCHYRLDSDALAEWVDRKLEKLQEPIPKKLQEGNQRNSGKGTEETSVSYKEHRIPSETTDKEYNSLPTLSDSEDDDTDPFADMQKEPGPVPPTDPESATIDGSESGSESENAGLRAAQEAVDTDTPIPRFVRHLYRRQGLPDPKLQNRSNLALLDSLYQLENTHNTESMRRAMVRWVEGNVDFIRQWMQERKQPLFHFRQNINAYLESATITSVLQESVKSFQQGNPTVCENKTTRGGAEAVVPAVSDRFPGVPVGTDTVNSPSASWQVETWNRIVVSKPYSGRTPSFPSDPDFTLEFWEKACTAAERIISAKREEASWLTLRWALKADPVNGENWRRLADGELNFMAVQNGQKKHRDQGIADSASERYKLKCEKKTGE